MNESPQNTRPFQANSLILRMMPWIGIAIFVLYIYHNPVRWDAIFYNIADPFLLLNIQTITHNWLNILFLFVLVLNGITLGIIIQFGLLRDKCKNFQYEESLAIGWGFLSLITFLGALLQVLTVSMIGIVLTILTITGIAVLAKVYIKNPNFLPFKNMWQGLKTMQCSEWIAVIFIALAIFYSFVSSLMPPTQSDGLRYHLTAPRWYLNQGGFLVIPNLTFSNFPFIIEYLFVLPMAFGLDSVAKGVHFVYFLITLALVFRLGYGLGGRSVGIFSALLIATIPFSPIFSSWSFIEFGLTAYTLLGFTFALRLIDSQSNRESYSLAILTGLAGGFVIGCKYIALASLFFIFLMIVVAKKQNMNNRFCFKSNLFYAFLTGLVAFAVGFPWYLKNWILFGNPLYPFLGRLFPTPDWSNFNALFFQYHAGLKGNLTAVLQASIIEKLTDFFTLPFRLTFFPGEPWHPEDFGSWPLGSIWLFLLILLLFYRCWEKGLAWPILYSFFLFFLWAFTYRDTRFLLPSLAIAVPALATIAIQYMKLVPEVRWLYLGKIFYSTAYTTGLLLIPVTYAPWGVVSGTVSEDIYLSHYNDSTRDECQAFFWLRENVHPEDVVLLHGVDQPYYCPNPYIAADFFDTDPLLTWSWQHPTYEELFSKIEEHNVKYMVYNYGKINRYGIFYRFFRLPPEKGYDLLQEWVNHEYRRVYDPRAYQQWIRSFLIRLDLAESNSKNIDALTGVLSGNGMETVFQFDESPNNPSDGIVIYKIPSNSDKNP